jgi:restriction endonuclease S subunit
MNISNGIYCIGRGIAAIRSNRKSTTMFLEQQILENLNAILGLTSGSTFQNIDGKTLREFKSSYPSLKEQTKIANFLSYIDNKVDTEKRILMQYETQKNYLLQSMFV